MHIQQIEVEGIQSFRERQIVEIGGFNLLAAVGKNGHGKSTIVVDAILFAFWGKVRTRTIDEMISVGAPRAFVAVDFTLSDGTLYRVQRTAPRTGAGEGAVFVADDAEASGWRPVTEDGVKEVTAYVSNLLGMTYEVARQTWIAQQGDYGLFSKSVPSKRFDLLSGIFDLDKYSPLAKSASEKHKASEAALEGLDGSLREINDQLAALDEPTSGPTDDEITEKIVAATAEMDGAQQAIAELNVGDPVRKAEEAEASYRHIYNGRTSALAAARTALAASEADLAANERRLSSARDAAEQTARRRASEVAQRREQAVRAAERRKTDATTAISRIDAAHWALGERRSQLIALASDADAKKAAAADARARAAQQAELRSGLLGQHSEATKQIAASEKRIETLRLSLHDDAAAACFACNQHLSPEDARALIESQEREIADAKAAIAEITAQGQAAAQAAATAEAEAGQADADEAAIRRNIDAGNREIVRMETEAAQRPEYERAVSEADGAIAAAVSEAEAAEAAARAERDDVLAAAHEAHRVAAEALQERIATARAEVAKREERSEDEARAQAAAEQLRAAAQVEVDGAANRRSQLQAVVASSRAAVAQAEAVRAERAQRSQRRAALEARSGQLAAERADADRDRRYWSVLVKAYSNSGIPAMLLTSITEELNEAINISLDHISNGELAIVLRATRETKAGTAESKITVLVDTPEGMRSYESLSGGQQFRVDLAIRTGLARVITRRTGTPIQTFILDEGWGSLDEDGIRSAFDTLQRLSTDFNVLTVSHIDSVRNAFPARIHVDKSTGTSIAEVMAA